MKYLGITGYQPYRLWIYIMNDNSLDYSMYSGFCCAAEDGNDTTFGSLASAGQSTQAVGVAPRRALAYGQQDGDVGRSGLHRTPGPFNYGQVAGVHAYGQQIRRSGQSGQRQQAHSAQPQITDYWRSS